MSFEPRSIREDRLTPTQAKEKRLLCPHCNSSLYVPMPWGASEVEKLRLVGDAINEHRRLCAGAPAEAQRVYRIDYPRA